MQNFNVNNGNDDFVKFIDDLLLKYPNPVEFVRQINFVFDDMRILDVHRLNYLLSTGEYLYSIFKFIHVIIIFENCISLINPVTTEDEKLLKIKIASLGYIGAAYSNLGYYQQAIDYQNKSLEIARRIGDVAGESRDYLNLGLAYHGIGDYQKAIEHYDKSLEIAKRIGDVDGESRCYGNLGATYFSLSEYHRAIDYQNSALDIAKRIGDMAGESTCYNNLGLTYTHLGDYQKAIDYQKESLEIAKRIGDVAVESHCYNDRGLAYFNLGDYQNAIEHHNKSLEIAKRIGDVAVESMCYGNLGNAYTHLGDFHKAIEHYDKSLEITKRIGDVAVESMCYNNLGLTYSNLGDYQKAIDYYNNSLEIAKRIGDIAGESRGYGNLGLAYSYLGDYYNAIDYHNKSLETAKRIGDVAGESKCYNNLGLEYHGIGDYRKAIEHYDKSLKITKRIGDVAVESHCYNNLGLTYSNLGDYQKAIDYYNLSLEIAKRIGDVAVESHCYSNLGLVYLELDKQERENNNGHINPDQRYLKTAYENLKKSIELDLKIGSNLVEDEHKVGYYGLSANKYETIVSICLELKKENEAFEFVARGKSKALIDLMSTSKVLSNIKSVHGYDKEMQKLLNEEKVLLEKKKSMQLKNVIEIDNLQSKSSSTNWSQQTPDSPSKSSSSSFQIDDKIYPPVNPTVVGSSPIFSGYNPQSYTFSEISDKLNMVYDKMEKIDLEYVSLKRPKSITLEKTINRLNLFINADDIIRQTNIAMVEYFVTNSGLYIFCIFDGQLFVKEVKELTKQKLGEYVKLYDKFVINYLDDKIIDNSWLQIGKYLLEPIYEFIEKSDHIIFVPHSLLHYIPIHALSILSSLSIKNEEEPLIKTHTVSYLLNTSLLQFMSAGTKDIKNKNISCNSFGVAYNKEDELFLEEAKEVANIFGIDEKTNYIENPAKDKVLDNLDADILHFSCHGYFDDKEPLESGIFLEDKEKLTAKDFLTLSSNQKIGAELVTLSACDTGISENKPGDELIGLSRSLIYAGANSLILSLWPVSSQAAKEIIISLYNNLKNGDTKATALQKAQLDLRDRWSEMYGKEEGGHPYFWAPFILIGDWR